MKREALLRELRKYARDNGLRFEIISSRGKGSHYRVELGDRATTVKSGELKPGYVNLIKKQLAVE